MKVINKHTYKEIPTNMNVVPIHRGTPLGNPFLVGPDYTRDQAVKMFKEYFIEHLLNRTPEIEQAFRALKPDDQLLCFCAPQACHGDVVAELYARLINDKPYEENLAKLRTEMMEVKAPSYLPEEDGLTHINIYSRAATELGQLLSNFAHTPVELDTFGRFESVEGFWHWLATGKQHEVFRNLYGYKAKMEAQAFYKANGKPKPVEDFVCHVKQALLRKIEQHPVIQELLKHSTLPLTHYYTFKDNSGSLHVVDMSRYRWITNYLEKLRRWTQGQGYRLIMAGSRYYLNTVDEFDDLDLVETNIHEFFPDVIEVVYGGAKGADKQGLLYAQKHQLPYKLFKADWDKHGKAAGMIRNKEMADYGDKLIAFWNGQSNGTRNMIEIMQTLGKQHHTVHI